MTADLARRLQETNLAFAAKSPGERTDRQPVHTVYGGAHLFKAETAGKLGALAVRTLETHLPDAAALGLVLGLDPALARAVHPRVVEKLRREPVEDFRIDFEDGYGHRPDEEEDGHARQAAAEVAKGLAGGTLPPFLGIRVKSFSEETRERSFRTIDVFLTALSESLPPGFVVTLPKVTTPEQVAICADLLDLHEKRLGLTAGAIRMEIMIETPASVLAPDGGAAPRALAAAARGRCVGAHFGTYDYTASLAVTAAHQKMSHTACDFAKHVMQVSLAGTGVWISDGATNVMPVGDADSVRAAWRQHYDDVRRSLVAGFYQGWDLHPAQLVTRYTAVYAFFLEGLSAATDRLKNFVAKAAQATLVGDVFDDAATGQGLLNYFLRGVSCGALREEEALAAGVTLEELRGRSFLKILKARKGG